MKEIWLPIPNYEGFQASNLGRIKSMKRLIDYGNRFCLRKERILKPHKSKVGYYTVAPFQKTTHVHTLIALAFFGERKKGTVIDHINGDHLDNNINNLRYVTQKENVHNAIRLNKIPMGEKCSWSKLKTIDIINIRNDKRTQKLIAIDYNVSKSTISEIKKFKTWKSI